MLTGSVRFLVKFLSYLDITIGSAISRHMNCFPNDIMISVHDVLGTWGGEKKELCDGMLRYSLKDVVWNTTVRVKQICQGTIHVIFDTRLCTVNCPVTVEPTKAGRDICFTEHSLQEIDAYNPNNDTAISRPDETTVR